MFSKLSALVPVLVLLFAGSLFAGISSTATEHVYYKYANVSVVSTGAYDTLGATDSSTILSNYVPAQNGELVLCYGTITGTGSDSVKMILKVRAYNAAGTLIGDVASTDTISSATGQAGQISIPIGDKALGYKFTVKLFTITGAGTQTILNALEIWRRYGVAGQQIISR